MSMSDIISWTNIGRANGAIHLLVVCDEFNYTYYPVYVMPSMQKYIKLYKFYNLSLCNKGILQWPYYAALDHWLLGASW